MRLYKYRKFDCENDKSLQRTKDIFQKNELFFSSSSTFNDPFDCLVHLDFKRVTKDEFWRYYNNVLTKKTERTPQQIKKSFEDAYNSNEIENKLIGLLQTSFNNGGVYSLTSKNNDILMWSHYTDGHRGYCFELDSLELKAQKVKYRTQFQKFNIFKDDNLLNVLLFTKSSHWKYEREWRYFSKKLGPISISDNSIRSAILGSQMDEENRKSLLNIINSGNHQPAIFEAVIDSDRYSIFIKQYKT